MKISVCKPKFLIKDNRTNSVYILEFLSRLHAENFVENENRHMGKELEIINIKENGGSEDEEI